MLGVTPAAVLTDFDKNNDGQLSFDEFLEKTWRLYNRYTDAGANVTEQDFVQCFLGPADDPISGPAVSSARAEPYRKLFQTMNHGGKGYIVKNDVVQHARREFGSLDKSHDGFISMNELNGK